MLYSYWKADIDRNADCSLSRTEFETIRYVLSQRTFDALEVRLGKLMLKEYAFTRTERAEFEIISDLLYPNLRKPHN